MAKKGKNKIHFDPHPLYLQTTEEIHLETLCFNLKMERGIKVHNKDEEGRTVITLHAQFIGDGAKSFKAMLGDHLLGVKEFSDRTVVISFVGVVMDFIERHLPNRMAQVGCTLLDEAIHYALEQSLGREIDKTELRKYMLQAEKRQFNKRWRMPKNSNFECTREELIEKVRDAIFELDAVHKWRERGKRPVKEIVAEHLGYWDGAALSKVMAKRTILSWKTMLQLCGWHWLPENNQVRRFKN